MIGGGPWVVSPVARDHLPDLSFDLAVSVRAVVPKEYTREAELFGYHSGWGACLLAGVDMTFGRFASEE